MECVARELVDKCTKWRFLINIKENKYLCIGKDNTNIKIDSTQIGRCSEHVFLATCIVIVRFFIQKKLMTNGCKESDRLSEFSTRE